MVQRKKEHDSTPATKYSQTLVYIFNMSEDVWPFISAMSDRRSQLAELEENVHLADLRLFQFAAETSNILFISPTPISEEFLSYVGGVFGNTSIRVLVTKRHTGVISTDIVEDEDILKQLVVAANSVKRLTIISYATTPQFLLLVSRLRDKDISVYTPEAPEEQDAWTVNFYGSKSGIRQFAAQSAKQEPDFRMPEGIICSGLEDAASIAAKKYLKEGGVVIKTNKGHAGMGVLLFGAGDLPEQYKACEQKVLSKLKEEAYWDKFPIIVESYIPMQPTVGGGYPNVEFKILKNGRIEFLYYCGMRMSKDGIFGGVEIHNDVVSDRVAAQMVDTGFFIGEQYAASGYRGYYDVDFVAGKNGQLYVTESNVRSTGGTFVYTTALALFGRNFMYETYILSHNTYRLPKKSSHTFSSVAEKLKLILFDKKTKEGLIIASENLLVEGKLAYMIFGKTKKRAYDIEAEMQKLLTV